VLTTIAILMVGSFVICAAVLALAFVTDGRPKAAAVLLTSTGASAHRPGRS
jgi:hypothetical protein